MNLLKSIWRIIISVFGFLIVWIFLPVFSIIGIYYQITGKVPKKLQVGEIDARFLERAERLKTKGYRDY